MKCKWLSVALLLITSAVSAAPRISPAGGSVPENLLRIDLQLDKPLAQPLNKHNIKLFDQNGAVIEEPFLDLVLPSRDGLTITFLLHPGRLKSGVLPNVTLGTALREGEYVTLEIAIPSLRVPIQKSWSVGPALRQKIDPTSWRVVIPNAKTRSALDISLQTLIGADAQNFIAVADSIGRKVEGETRMSANESHWQFTPTSPWQEGTYTLIVHPMLEDVAGNRICALFEQVNLHSTDCVTEWRSNFQVLHVGGNPRSPQALQ
jgi:hypothetical protein